ncbi:MAG TPA: hypothetical protein VG371_13015, partial [Solirubrobacteraceae bacterium]|nr:hypothetical protein [Solirubrobacteraceae bacterium]
MPAGLGIAAALATVAGPTPPGAAPAAAVAGLGTRRTAVLALPGGRAAAGIPGGGATGAGTRPRWAEAWACSICAIRASRPPILECASSSRSRSVAVSRACAKYRRIRIATA